MKKYMQTLLLAVFAVAVTGCLGDDKPKEGSSTLDKITEVFSKVGQVKGGHFLDNSTTTIGQAFDNSFGSPEWREGTTAKGQNFVEFKGVIDADFAEMIAKSIIAYSGDAVMDPFSSTPYMDHCLGEEYSRDFKKQMLSNAFGFAFVPENQLVALISGEFTRHIMDKQRKLIVQFEFNKSENADFQLGYYGFLNNDEMSNCEIQQLIPTNEFIKFVYSNHVYTDFDFNKIASEIVDQTNPIDMAVISTKIKERTKGSQTKYYALLFAIEANPKVVQKKIDDKKNEEERERLEEEEKVRKAEEEALRIKKNQEENLKKAKKELITEFNDYKKKMDDYKTACSDGRCAYPEWNVIGYEPPESEYFYYTHSDGYVWNLELRGNEEILGVHCHWIIKCFNVEGCECNVSEDCKNVAPTLKTLCDIEYDSY